MKLVSVFCLLLMGGLALYAAPPLPPPAAAAKKKPAPAATAKKPAVRRAKPAASRNTRKPTASSRAIYSRSNSKRGRRTTARAAAVQKPSSNWQARPTPERYAEIQQVLAEKGFYKGETNGAWGPESVTALKEFQRSQNLDPDGKLGSLSLIALGMGPKRIVASAVDTQGAMQQQAVPPASAIAEGAGRQQ